MPENRPFFVLAPMDDVTDTVFRQIVHNCAKPDLMYTEFVNVDGLQSPGRKRLLHKLKLSAAEGPVVAQLWGLKPHNFYKTAKEIADGTLVAEANVKKEKVNFVGIDLNMGCPVKTVIKNGACAALINNRALAGEIVDAVKEGAGDMPVSVKTRLGFNEVDLSWPEFLLIKKINMLTIHGRTAKQMSKVPAEWDLIGKVRHLRDNLSPETLLVGNGDVASRTQGIELAKKYELDGIMVGRGIFHDPYLFANTSPWQDMSKEKRLALFLNHIQMYLCTYDAHQRKFEALRKFCKVYINGFEGAAELRAKFMEAENPKQALKLLQN